MPSISAHSDLHGVNPPLRVDPAFHPAVLLKLYVYGYLNRVQSSRRLEREAGRNLELLWLLGRLVPDHKTIADFRKDNGLGLRQVCARFVALCREMGLLADGTRRRRRQQVQVGQQPRPQLHEGQDGAPSCTDGGEHCALHRPARDRRPAGADGGACRHHFFFRDLRGGLGRAFFAAGVFLDNVGLVGPASQV